MLNEILSTRFNLTSVITLIGAFLSSFLGILILIKRVGNLKANTLFFCFILSLNISILNIGFLIYTGNYRLFPHMLTISTIVSYLPGPFYFLFIRKFYTIRTDPLHILHFIPSILVLMLFFPFLIKTGNEKILIFNLVTADHPPFWLYLYFNLPGIIGAVHIGFYYLVSHFYMKKKHHYYLMNLSRYPREMSNNLLNGSLINAICIALMAGGILTALLTGKFLKLAYEFIPIIVITYYCVVTIRVFINPENYMNQALGLIDEPIKGIQEKPEIYSVSETRILGLIYKGKYYCDPDLTLPDLAKKLGIKRNTLSSVINNHSGMNFYDFINRMRVDQVKKALEEGVSGINLLEVAYNAGFKSKTTFNVCFKRYTGMTPSQFKKEKSKKQKYASSFRETAIHN